MEAVYVLHEHTCTRGTFAWLNRRGKGVHDLLHCCWPYLRDEGQLLALLLASLFQGSKSKVRFVWLASGHHLSYRCFCTRQVSV